VRVYRIVIVGGGLAGLAAAWELVSASEADSEVLVLDGSDRVGGKLRQEVVGGRLVDVGAESMLAVRPEARELIAEIGAGQRLVIPATTAASVWSHGALHPLPPGSLMGVPRRPADATGILSAQGMERLRAALVPPAPTRDVSVGDYVAAALGDEVVDRLVDPLLGGVYAGDARQISLAAAVPAIHAKALSSDPLLDSSPPTPESPSAPAQSAFIGIDGGVGVLPELLADAIAKRGGRIRTGAVVREVRRAVAGWEIVAGPTIAPEVITADAVILALPPAPARRLLGPVAPSAAHELAAIETASMAIVTFAFPRVAMPALPGSGFLVPPVEGRAIKASTFSSQKWGWLADAAPETAYVRASLGRHREEAALQVDDRTLAARALADLRAIAGALPDPLDAHVQRWGGALPQYAVGHLDRIALVRKAIGEIDGLEVAGAAYDGVGIPAVIGSGRRAARAIRTAYGPGE
jgi:oxygen-dependent protoporphyrinogen oxidase